MQMKTYAEKLKIKRTALEKLDELIQAELDRLYDNSPNESIIEQFHLVIPKDRFKEEELKCIQRNIAQLCPKAKNCDLAFLNITIQCRPIINPWDKDE